MKRVISQFVILIFIVFSCSRAIGNPIDKIINTSGNNEIKELLEYPVKTSVSPSSRYIFVYAIGAEPFDDDDVLQKDALKKDFKIDNFVFNKGEFKWWFVFDISKKKIINKGSNLVLFNDNPIWDEKNSILILMTAISPSRDLLFYNSKINKNKTNMLYVYFKDTTSYLVLNNKYLAYQYVYKKDDFSGMPLEIGIKVRDLETGKDIATINPTQKNGTLNIVKWESDKKLKYKEVDRNNNVIKETTYVIK